jgi:hypothetical protein
VPKEQKAATEPAYHAVVATFLYRAVNDANTIQSRFDEGWIVDSLRRMNADRELIR